MQDKTCIVTGGNAGIGLAIARGLAERGAKVIIWSRTEEKGRRACEQLVADCPKARVDFVSGDLASQAAIREGAGDILEKYPRIDVLVNNAAVWNSVRKVTVDGLEEMFAVNHLAYFLLSRELYPALARSPEGRIICVASGSHSMIKQWPDDPLLTHNYHGLRAYALGKLANVLFTYEFHRRKPHEHVSIHALQPGLVQTDIGLKHANWFHRLAWRFRRNMRGNQTPEEGARTPLFLASSSEPAGQSGLYWAKEQAVATSPLSYDQRVAGQLWEASLRYCGIDRYFI